MKITKVSFDKTIGMPNYSNDRPGVVEATLEPGEKTLKIKNYIVI